MEHKGIFGFHKLLRRASEQVAYKAGSRIALKYVSGLNKYRHIQIMETSSSLHNESNPFFFLHTSLTSLTNGWPLLRTPMAAMRIKTTKRPSRRSKHLVHGT